MKTLIASLALATLLVSSPLALAKKDGRKSMLAGYKQLDLTREQKSAVRTIMQNAKSERELYAQDRQSAVDDIQTLMALKSWNEDAMSASILQQIESDKQAKLIAAKAKHQAYKTLTEEQRTALDEYHSQRLAKLETGATKDARKSKRKGKRGIHRIFAKLDLSEQQKDSIAAFKETAKYELESNRADIAASRKSELALVHTNSFDQAAWVSLYEENQPKMLAIGLQKAKNNFDSLAILNDEQREKLQKIMEKRSKKRKHA